MLGPCPLCGRELVQGTSVNEHHLVPKTHGGRDKAVIHRICHNKIHSVFSERELTAYYHTFERLRAHEEIAKFVRWVRRKEPTYYKRHAAPRARRR